MRRSAVTSVRSVAAGALAASLMSACGLPGDSSAEQVEDDAVPYNLLDPAGPSTEGTSAGQPSRPAPTVFWLLGERLVPATTEASCADDPTAVVDGLLAVLEAGPRENERASGRSTALPPESDLVLVDLRDGVAEIRVETTSEISPDRLPAAAGQVTLTLISAPGVSSVQVVEDGEPVAVPLPGGALTSEPLTAGDYLSLIPKRLEWAAVVGCRAG